jgi:hypothetical protein
MAGDVARKGAKCVERSGGETSRKENTSKTLT